MTRPTPTLAAPLTISEWWRNRGGESNRVTLTTWKNRTLVDVRVWRTVEGRLKPTTKGFAAELRHLPRLVSALTKAESKARELHLLPDDDGGDQ